MYFFSNSCTSHLDSFSVPLEVKSSPCTTSRSPLSLCQKAHGEVDPRQNPMDSSMRTYHGGQNDYLNNSKIIVICNRTNTKLPGKLNSFRVGNGNFENSKFFGCPVILKKNTQLSCFFSLPVFSLIFSCLPSSVLSLLLHLVSSFISDIHFFFSGLFFHL